MTAYERINLAVIYTNGSPDEITAAILATLAPEMAVVKAAMAYLEGGKRRPQPEWTEGLGRLREAVRALPPEGRGE